MPSPSLLPLGKLDPKLLPRPWPKVAPRLDIKAARLDLQYCTIGTATLMLPQYPYLRLSSVLRTTHCNQVLGGACCT